MKFFSYCVLVILFVCSFSCKHRQVKPQIIPQDSMKVIIWDLVSADQWNSVLLSTDTSLKHSKNNLLLYQEVFNLHHTTKDEFFKSYQLYEETPDKMKEILDSTAAYGARQRINVNKR